MIKDATSEVGVQGEFNRVFNPDHVRGVLDGLHVFVSPDVQQYTLLVKPGKKTVINGQVIVEDDITAFFVDFTYRTADADIANLIRNSDAFKTGRIKELGTLRQETKASRLEAKAKEVAGDPELTRAVLAALKQGKSATPEVVK